MREIPETLEAVCRPLPNEALPAATDTQSQVALLETTIERVIGMLSDLPGAGILRRAATRSGSSETAGADGTACSKPRIRR